MTSQNCSEIVEFDPNARIASFLEICDTFKMIGVVDDEIRLRLFPFSLRDKATTNWFGVGNPNANLS
jgi:hypothetical protein